MDNQEKPFKIEEINRQLRKERQQEDEKVSKMTDEQRLEYLKNKYQTANDFAKSLKMNSVKLSKREED